MAFNVLSYTQNVAKSITYATVDKVKKMNPVLEEFMDTNADLSKQVFSSIKDFRGTVRKGKDWLVKQDLYEAADIGFHAVIDDIRSGKFYNRERIDEMNNRAAGSLTEGLDDMMGDPFAEIDGRESSGNIKESQMEQELSRDTQSTLEVMDNVGSKVTNGVAMATMANAETISKTNIKIAQKNQAHNEFLTNKLSVGMGAINSTIASLIEFNNKVVHPYIEGSIKWQSDLMSAHNETNALLKEIIANQQKAITPETEQKKRENITLQSIGEVPDLKEYGKLIWKNIMDQTGGVLDMFNADQNGGINPLFTLVASPLQKIPEAIVNTFIPKMVEKAAEDLNEGMEGFFASAIAKFNRMADDDSEGSFISNLIGKVLGIQSAGKIKSRPDINAIGKKAIAWDQESKHALTRVIPDTLAKILAAQTKTTAQLFDYNTGMYTSMDAINEKYDPKKLVEDAAIAATREYMEPIKDMIESVKFGEDDYQLREDIYKALNDMAVQMYNTDRVITPELVAKLMKDDREIKLQQTMGLSGYSDEVVQLIAGAITGLGGFNGKTRINKDFIKSIQTLNREIFNKKAGMKRDMDALSEAGSLALNMQNNFNADEYRDDAFIMKKGRTAYSSDQQLKQQLNPMKDIGYSILARQKDMSNLLVSIDQVLHDGINVSHVDTVRWVDHVAGRGERIFDTPNRSHVYRGADGRRQYVPNQPPSGPNVVPTGNYNSRSQHIAFDRINKVDTLREDTADRVQRDREYALSRHNSRADELQRHGARIAQYNQMEQNLAYRDTNSDSDAESQAIYKGMIAHTLSNADYRKYQQAVKENKAKEGKMTPISWFKQLMNIDDEDAKANTFLNGLEELSQKPAQFLTNVIHRIDERFYNVVFGEDDEDKLAPKSFMNQLTTRLGYIFRDFSGFLKDEVFAPLKDTLFGEEGYFSKATEWAKDKLNIEDGDIMDFIFGKVDENGERHGGMFGDKINFAKSSMKEVYGELGDILVPVDGKYELNKAGLTRAIDKKNNRVLDKNGNDTGITQEELYNAFQSSIVDDGSTRRNLWKMLDDFKTFSGGRDITNSKFDDLRKSVEDDVRNRYKDQFETGENGELLFTDKFTQENFNNLVNQAAIQKYMKQVYDKGDRFRKFDQITLSNDRNFEDMKNYMKNRNIYDVNDDTFEASDKFKNAYNNAKSKINGKNLSPQTLHKLITRQAYKDILDSQFEADRNMMDTANLSIWEDYDANAKNRIKLAQNIRGMTYSDIQNKLGTNNEVFEKARNIAQSRNVDFAGNEATKILNELLSDGLDQLSTDTVHKLAEISKEFMNFASDEEVKESDDRLKKIVDIHNKLSDRRKEAEDQVNKSQETLNNALGFTMDYFKSLEEESINLTNKLNDIRTKILNENPDLSDDQIKRKFSMESADIRTRLDKVKGEIDYKRDIINQNKALVDDVKDKQHRVEVLNSRLDVISRTGSKEAEDNNEKHSRHKGNTYEDMQKRNTLHAAARKGLIPESLAENSNFAKGGMVRKTGVIAASEGELIIPAKYNPFYHGSTGLSESLKKENKAIDQYLASFGGNFNIRNFAGPDPSTITADDLEGQGDVVDVQIEQLTEGSKKKKKRKFGNMEDSTNPEDYKYGFGKRLALKTTDRAMDAIKRRKTNRARNKNFKKLNSEQQALIREYGYDGRYNELNEYAQTLYDNGDFEGVLEAIGKLEEGVNAAAEDNAADKYESNKERLFKGMLDSAKETIGDHFPSLIGSGLIGAGVSLVTGAVGGPLLGAAIGAGTDLAIKSEGVKNWLFGEYDDDGRRKGNIISKDLANNIEKYLPGMAKGAIAGGITSILPFVPGGPVSGIILGSAIGFAKNNEKIKNTLFGYMDEEHNEWHDGILPKNFIEKLQGVVPDAVLGMLGGAAGTAILGGPFGLVGNMALGGAIGILVSTETFQDKLFGKKDPATGIRQGGLLGAVKEGFVDPLIDTGKSIKDKLVDWFKRDIAHPLASAIKPLAKQGGLLLGGIATGISRIVGDKFANEIGGGFSGLGHFLREKVGNLARAGLGIAQATARPVGKMISAPTRFIGNLGERFRKRHVADGDATYMTAKQRLQYRQELEDNVVYKKYDSDEYDEDGYLIHRKGDVMVDDLGQPIKDGDRGFKYFHNTLGRGKMKKRGKHADKFAQFDEMLVGMDKDQLTELRSAVNYLKDPNQEAQRQRKKSVDTINDVVHNQYGLSYKQSKHLLSLFRDGELDKASTYIGELGLTSTDETALRNTLTQQYSIYQASDETLAQSKGFRNKLYKELDSRGIKDINDGNLDKYLKLIDQEYNEKDKMNPIEKLDESQKERHQEIVSLFKEAIDNIRAMNDKDFRKRLIDKRAEENKMSMESQNGIFAQTLNRYSRGRLGNSGALWGRNYDMVYREDPETGEQQWFMINKKTGEETQVDAAGNPVDGSDRPVDAQLDTKGRRLKNKLKRGAGALWKASGAWDKTQAANPVEAIRNKRHLSGKEKALKKIIEDYIKKEGIDIPDDIRYYEKIENGKAVKKENKDYILKWLQVDSYDEAIKKLEEQGVNLMKDSQYGSKEDRASYFRHRISEETGISTRRIKRAFKHKSKGDKNKRGIFSKNADGSMHNLNEEEYYMDHAGGDYSGEKGKHIVGEEADVLNKRRTIFDLFGNPITVVKSKDGRWVKDQNDSDNKEAGLIQKSLLTMGDKITGKLSDIGKDVKDGFLHFFNIDTERDGWLKTMLKVGSGVLGVLTAAGVAARSQTWWEERIKPALVGWYQAHVQPVLQQWLEPIRPAIAKLAIGIDTTIQKIPNSIHALGNRIRGFIVDDLPGIWSTKILPFYQDGMNWILDNVSTITERVLNGIIKVAPAIISGAIKGATKFLSNDIYSIIGSIGRRDADGIKQTMTNSAPVNAALTAVNGLEAASEGLKRFDGASRIAASLGVTQDQLNSAAEGKEVTESDLAAFYNNENLNQKHPSSSADTMEGYAAMDTPVAPNSTSKSSDGTSSSNANYSTSNLFSYSEAAASSAGVPTTSAAADKAYDEAYNENKTAQKEQKSTSASSIVNKAKTNTSPSKVATAVNSVTSTRRSDANIVNDNGVYNTTNPLMAGSSYGISTYNASYDESTGLVYNESGQFIPYAFYDPATGNITDTPTEACLDQYPDINANHEEMLTQMNNTIKGDSDGSAPFSKGAIDWWGMTASNLSDSADNIASAMSNPASIGGRLTGLSTFGTDDSSFIGTGLTRSFITGKRGIVGKSLKKLGKSWSKKGIIRRGLSKPINKVGKVFNFTAEHSLPSLIQRRNANNAKRAEKVVNKALKNIDLEDYVNRYKFAVNNEGTLNGLIDQLGDTMSIDEIKSGYGLESADDVLEEAQKKINKEISEAASKKSSKFASKVQERTAKNILSESLDDVATGKGKLGSSIASKLKKLFNDFLESSLFNSISKNTGVTKKALAPGLGNSAEATAKILTNSAEKGGAKIASKLGHAIPLINWAFYIADFMTGWAKANDWLGLTDAQIATLDIPWPLLRMIVGLANVVNNIFTLGILPMESLLDIFTSFLLPAFGVDMSSYQKAVENSKKEVQIYRDKIDDQLVTMEQYNEQNGAIGSIGNWFNDVFGGRTPYERSSSTIKSVNDATNYAKAVVSGKKIDTRNIHFTGLKSPNLSSKLSHIDKSKSIYNRAASMKAMHGISASGSGLAGYYGKSSIPASFKKDLGASEHKGEIRILKTYLGNDKITVNDMYNYYGSLASSYMNGTIADRQSLELQESNSQLTSYIKNKILGPTATMNDVFNYYAEQYNMMQNSVNNTEGINYVDSFGPENISITMDRVGPGLGRLNTYQGTAGSLKSMASYITPANNYVGSGSGIAGTGTPASCIVNFYGGSTKVKAKESIDFKRGTDIVSESCRIYVYLETKGGINNFQIDKKGEFSVGAGNWKGKEALKLIKDIINSNYTSANKILGEKLATKIKTSNKFNNKVFNTSEINMIKKILASAESKKLQKKKLISEFKSLIKTAANNYTDPKVVMFNVMLAKRIGSISDVQSKVKNQGVGINLDDYFKAFVKQCKNGIYKNNKEYCDDAYKLINKSSVTSTDTSKVDDKSLDAGLGTVEESTSSSESGGNWLTRLKEAITNMGYALFGIDNYSKNGSTDKDSTGNYDQENQSLADQEQALQQYAVYEADMDDEIHTLAERLNILKEYFENSPDYSVQSFAKSNLLQFMMKSINFQKFIKGKVNSVITSNISANDTTNIDQYKYKSHKKLISGSTYNIATNEDINKVTANIDPTVLAKVVKNIDTVVSMICSEFVDICNDDNGAMLKNIDNLKTYSEVYLDLYIADHTISRDTSFHKILRRNKTTKKIISQYYKDRLKFIKEFRAYINGNNLATDYHENKFTSKEDKQVADLLIALGVLNDENASLDNKEEAWNDSVGLISKLLEVDNILTSKSIDDNKPINGNNLMDVASEGYSAFYESINKKGKLKHKGRKGIGRRKYKKYLYDMMKSSYPKVTDFDSLFKYKKGKDGQFKLDQNYLNPFDPSINFKKKYSHGKANTVSGDREDLLRNAGQIADNIRASGGTEKDVNDFLVKVQSGAYDTSINDKNRTFDEELKAQFDNVMNSSTPAEGIGDLKVTNPYNPYTIRKYLLSNMGDNELSLASGYGFDELYDNIRSYGSPFKDNIKDHFIENFENLSSSNAIKKALSDTSLYNETQVKNFVDYFNYKSENALSDFRITNKPVDYSNIKDEYDLVKKHKAVIESIIPYGNIVLKDGDKPMPFKDYVMSEALMYGWKTLVEKQELVSPKWNQSFPYLGLLDENTMKDTSDENLSRILENYGNLTSAMKEGSIYDDTMGVMYEAMKASYGQHEPDWNPVEDLTSLEKNKYLNYIASNLNDSRREHPHNIFSKKSTEHNGINDLLAQNVSAQKKHVYNTTYKTPYSGVEGLTDIVKTALNLNKRKTKSDGSIDDGIDDTYLNNLYGLNGINPGEYYASQKQADLYKTTLSDFINNFYIDKRSMYNVPQNKFGVTDTQYAYLKSGRDNDYVPIYYPDSIETSAVGYNGEENLNVNNIHPLSSFTADQYIDQMRPSVNVKPTYSNLSIESRASNRPLNTSFMDPIDNTSIPKVYYKQLPKEFSDATSKYTPPYYKSGKGTSLRDVITAKGNNFISQLDYKNMKFSDGESMADAGCGPAVAAMAINGLSGGASMMETAALADKYKTNGGTSADYFQDVFSRAGAKTTYYEGSKASSGAVKSLKAGQQVVLLGQDRNNKSKANSPFGPGNHYVLAKGMSNGKVAINDPEQHGTKIYNKNILKNTKLSMAVSGKGSGLYTNNMMKLASYAGKGYDKGRVNPKPGKEKIPSLCKKYKGTLVAACKKHGVGTEWVDFLLAMMTAESHGSGKDPMQASEGAGNSKKGTKSGKQYHKGPNGITDPVDSCYAGVYELRELIKVSGYNNPYHKAQVMTLAQGYNFGPGYITWLKGKTYTLKNAIEFGTAQAKKSGSSQYGTPNHAIKVWNIYTTTKSGKKAKSGKYGNYNATSTKGSTDSSSGSNGGTWMDRIINNINIMGKALLGMNEDGNGKDTASGYVGTGLASDVVKVAKAELGYKPSANNQSKYSKEFGVTNAQWCAYFVSWVFKKACGGVNKMKKVLGTGPVGSVTALMTTFKSKGMFKKNPHVGDVVIWKNGRSHTGIVISVNTKKKTFTTVEGNTGNDEVGKRTYSFSSATGFGRPNYESGSGSGITADSAYNSLLKMSGKGSNISKSGLNIDLTKSEKEIFDQIVSASDKAAISSASGKGSRMSNSVIRNTNSIQATDLVLRNAARGSSIGSRSNARAISRISNSGNFVYSGAGSNLIKSGINRSYGRGTSDSPTMNDIYETSNRINSSYDSDYSTYIDPDTGDELMLDEVYSGGASKKKAKKRNKAASKHAVNTVKQGFKNGGTVSTAAESSAVTEENTRNYILLRSMLTLLKSIEKSERKNADIVTILKKMYSKMGGSTSALNAILKNSKSKSSNSDKKKAKGSELYSGKAAQMANRMNNSSSSDMARLASITQSHSEDEYSEMNELIKELTRITMD